MNSKIENLALKAVSIVAPKWSAQRAKRRWYVRRAATYRDELTALTGWDAKIQYVKAATDFAASQMATEVRELLERTSQLRARRVLEIGTFEGGTLALFAQAATPDARILSLDLNYHDHRLHAYPALARPGQTITCHDADTHRPETLDFVRKWLGSELLDVLFIDGDHSYDGVKADYKMYAPLVRPGGLIAFHDVHPDSKTRYGIVTKSDVGEVPRFWKELVAEGHEHSVCVERDSQDGMGIGFLVRRAEANLSPSGSS